jgi:hypothetical protein
MRGNRGVGMTIKKRSEIIDALSWAEDENRGRWGVEYATEVLEAHEASLIAEYETERLRRDRRQLCMMEWKP